MKSEKWIVDVRPMKWEEAQTPDCDFCEEKESSYWVEEFAMGLCDRCYNELKEEVGRR